MTDESVKKAGNPIPTEGFPSIYANIASVSATYNDLRIYFADQQPKTVATAPQSGGDPVVAQEASITPRICLILTPEFAKSVVNALAETISQYERAFGALRPTPQPPLSSAKAEERQK